ncbi:MAG: hypothetical protein IJA32_05565 [Lachnospiraceae bacterium]|nr:hypothetical protein [Lachnospiraceae bacterium]
MIGFARTDSKCCNTILGNALDKSEVKKAIHSAHYDYIINGVGVINLWTLIRTRGFILIVYLRIFKRIVLRIQKPS